MDKINWKNFIQEENSIIVQLGAYDGITCDEYGIHDLLLNKKHNAILVEPVSSSFKVLQKTYENANSVIKYENIAIVPSDTETAKIFLNGVESSLVRYSEENIKETEKWETVSTKKFNYLVTKYNLKYIDGLFIDIEGMELFVIEDILTNTSIPIKMIRYEFILCKDQEKLDSILKEHGYEIYMDATHRGDKVAILKGIL